jgi:hypothetical protein
MFLAPLLAAPVPSASTHPRAEARFGADLARLRAAIRAAQWPEHDARWCGVAAMAAVASYRVHGAYAVSQRDMAAYLDTSDLRSGWGSLARGPTPNLSPGFRADISRDVGTDPRAIAAGQAALGQAPYHQVIARQGADDATQHLVADLVRAREPIHAIVLHGSHSVLVSGVLAFGDPVANPDSISALEVWDPGFGLPGQNIQYAQMELVPIQQWLASPAYWGAPYSENRHGGVATDPDPSLGPYAYDPAHGQSARLWGGHYVYIRPDAPSDPAAAVSPDWALAPSGAVIAGARGELPTSYTGPAVTLDSGAPIPSALAAAALSPGAHQSSSPPWWLLLALLPLLLGGFALYAAIRAQLRLREAVVQASQRRSAAPPIFPISSPALSDRLPDFTEEAD